MADNKVNSGLLEFSEDQKVFVALDAETSEVKKAVTIDGDGVETDIQGVQPIGKKEITSTAEVNVASYATAQVVDDDLVAGNIKKDVDILGVVGSYEGGASDFALIDITIASNEQAAENNYEIPIVDTEEECITTIVPFARDSAVVWPSITYKGTLILYCPENIVISGSAAYDADTGYITITGNCTLKGVGLL